MNTEDEPGKASEMEPVSNKPKFLGVIEGFINSRYQPTRASNPDDHRDFRVMTSQEIILDLADMVDMELNDVAEAMMCLGYHTTVSGNKVGWLLHCRTN